MNKRKVFEQRLKTLQNMEEMAVQKQHLKAKLTARERLNILFDEGSFFELNPFNIGHFHIPVIPPTLLCSLAD